jgi:prevent-host-death family protein
MNTVNIRSLKHETAKILERIRKGESVEITRHGSPVARMTPLPKKESPSKNINFRDRLRSVYGDVKLDTSATQLIADERGDR